MEKLQSLPGLRSADVGRNLLVPSNNSFTPIYAWICTHTHTADTHLNMDHLKQLKGHLGHLGHSFETIKLEVASKMSRAAYHA